MLTETACLESCETKRCLGGGGAVLMYGDDDNGSAQVSRDYRRAVRRGGAWGGGTRCAGPG